MNFEQKLNEYIKSTNDFLEKYSVIPEVPQKILYEAMSYSLLAGGKRVRPVLTMAVCDMLGGDLQDACLFGCAIECIHTYSLIHDDLPCMDNDDLRRGKPTCHVVYGEANALLAGDGLLNSAFEIMSNRSLYKSIDDKKAIDIIKIISAASGKNGMIGGQIVDLESENQTDISAERLTYMHRLKTGALIRAAAETGAVIGNADSEKHRKIVEFSENLGLAFQIKDDILDVAGNPAILGKPSGSDVQNGKSTYVSIFGFEKSLEMLNECTENAKNALNIFGHRAEFLLDFTEYLTNREN